MKMPVQMIEHQITKVISRTLAIENGQCCELFLDLFRNGRLQFLGAFPEGWGSRSRFVMNCHDR